MNLSAIDFGGQNYFVFHVWSGEKIPKRISDAGATFVRTAMPVLISEALVNSVLGHYDPLRSVWKIRPYATLSRIRCSFWMSAMPLAGAFPGPSERVFDEGAILNASDFEVAGPSAPSPNHRDQT